MFGLKDSDLNQIRKVLQQFPEVEEAFIYGSRAIGNYRKGSDVDLALKGLQLNRDVVSRIVFILNEETLLPYFFDVLNYHTLTNQDLVDHIDRMGNLLYERSSVKK